MKAKTPAKPRAPAGKQRRQATGSAPPTGGFAQPALVQQEHGGALMAGGQGQGGRPKEALRKLCRDIYAGRTSDERHGAEFLGGVMRGTEGHEEEVLVVGSGKEARLVVRDVKPKLRDRLLAAELLMDRGYGKPEQAVQIEDERPRRTGGEIMAEIMEMLPRVLALLPVDRKEIGRLLARRRQIEVLVKGKEVSA